MLIPSNNERTTWSKFISEIIIDLILDSNIRSMEIIHNFLKVHLMLSLTMLKQIFFQHDDIPGVVGGEVVALPVLYGVHQVGPL